MTRTIQYTDHEGNEITIEVASLITGITVSADRKLSDGNYGSFGAFQSITAAIPEGLPSETITEIGDQLFADCESSVASRLETMNISPDDRRTAPPVENFAYIPDSMKDNPITIGPPLPTPDLDKAFGAREQGGDQTSEITGDFPLLRFPPKRRESQPGQTFKIRIPLYTVKDDTIELWQEKGKYPDLTYKITPEKFADYQDIFGMWQTLSRDDEGYPIPMRGKKPLDRVLYVRCTDKIGEDKDGNPTGPYHDVIKIAAS